MTHSFLFIVCGAVVDDTARFFKVKVGTSAQANRDYLYLLAESVNAGYYFEKWSEKTCVFFDRVIRSLYGDDIKLHEVFTKAQCVTARDLVRAMKANTLPPLNENVLRNQHHLLNVISTAYRCHSRVAAKHSTSA